MTSDVQVIPDRAYLLALGYGAMGPEALDALEVVIAEEIEDRVGRRLARSLTLSDFDRFHDLLDEDQYLQLRTK